MITQAKLREAVINGLAYTKDGIIMIPDKDQVDAVLAEVGPIVEGLEEKSQRMEKRWMRWEAVANDRKARIAELEEFPIEYITTIKRREAEILRRGERIAKLEASQILGRCGECAYYSHGTCDNLAGAVLPDDHYCADFEARVT